MGTAGPGGASQGGERPAEDVREQARRLRALPVDQVLGDLLLSMLTAAQVRLGRRDARLLIDGPRWRTSRLVPTCRASSPGRSTSCWDNCGWAR